MQTPNKLHQPAAGHALDLPFSERRVLLIAGDIGCLLAATVLLRVVLALTIATWVDARVFEDTSVVVLLVGIWLTLLAVGECYNLRVASSSSLITQALLIHAPIGIVFGSVVCWQVAAAKASMLGSQPMGMSVLWMAALAGILFVPLVIGWRRLSIQLFTSLRLRSRAMVIGSAATVGAVAERMRQALPQYKIVGAIADDVPLVPSASDSSARSALIQKITEMQVTELVLATEKPVSPALEWVIADCYERGIAIRPLAALYEEVLGWVPVHIMPQPQFPIPLWRSGNLPHAYQGFKRCLDMLVAFSGLVLLVPLFPFVALAIVLNSPGPIFYTQERVGKGGRTFRLVKFRSMVTDAERPGSAQWATRGDTRITRVGRFLRRTRIDELPQLLNVLIGDMSLVGPRPERPSFVELLAREIPFYRARLRVLPGLTGWAQINHGYTSSVEDTLMKIQYDLFYIKRQSFALDILILLRTVRVIVTFGGT